MILKLRVNSWEKDIYDGYLSEDYIVALEALEGYQFAYWMNENNDIVSYDERYYAHYGESGASNNIFIQSLHAVYTKEAVEKKPTISSSLILNLRIDDEGEVKKGVPIRVIYTGNGYEMKECGLIMTKTDMYKGKLTLENVDNDIIRKRKETTSGSLKFLYRYNIIVKMSEPLYVSA